MKDKVFRLWGRPAMFRGEMKDICFQNTLIRFRAFEAVDAEFALIVFSSLFLQRTL